MSMLWHAFWPMQPVQQNLANVFLQLANYLEAKSTLFHPVSNMIPQPHRIIEANLNAATVNALNQCKAVFLTAPNGGMWTAPAIAF